MSVFEAMGYMVLSITGARYSIHLTPMCAAYNFLSHSSERLYLLFRRGVCEYVSGLQDGCSSSRKLVFGLIPSN